MKIGLQGFWTGLYNESSPGSINFTNGKKVAKAVQFTENRSTSEASVYADDAKDDGAYAVTDVALGMTPNGFSLDELAQIIGAGSDVITFAGKETNVTSKNFTNEGARRGIGFWATESRSGIKSYRVIIYPNTAWRPNDSTEYNTKGESISFATESYSGKAYADGSGNYVYEKQFETAEDAVTFLNDVFSVSDNNSVAINKEFAEVAVGGELALNATTVPSDAEVTWTSDDTDKATVSGGVVTGVAVGTVTVTAAITVEGETYSDTCVVRVTAGE